MNRRRDPYTRMAVRLPNRDLAASILDLAAPLLGSLDPVRAIDNARRSIELAINVWNSHVNASNVWGSPKPKALAELRKSMRGKAAPAGAADLLDRLSERWRSEFAFDPRLVADWSYEAGEDGTPRLTCEMSLPDGVEAEVPPPLDKRIAIGGSFLDEMRIPQSAASYLIFPVENHRAIIDGDGSVTVYAKMPAALQLFAEGRLSPVGGDPVELAIGGRQLGPMVLADVRCGGELGRNDVAVLVFRPPSEERAK